MNVIVIISFWNQSFNPKIIQKSFNEHGVEKFLMKFDLSQVTGKTAQEEEEAAKS